MSERVGHTPTSQALAMLAAFASVGAQVFDLSLTDLSGSAVKGRQRPGQSLEQMHRSIGRILRNAERNQHNVIIRPRSDAALLIQLDDFTAEKAAQVGVLCLSPRKGPFQTLVKQKPRLLHLEFLAVKTPKKAQNVVQNYGSKVMVQHLPVFAVFATSKNQSFRALICWIEPFGGDRQKTP